MHTFTICIPIYVQICSCCKCVNTFARVNILHVSVSNGSRSWQGLSDSMIDRFFNPFYQGIFLSPLSEQSSRMFGFLFKV